MAAGDPLLRHRRRPQLVAAETQLPRLLSVKRLRARGASTSYLQLTAAVASVCSVLQPPGVQDASRASQDKHARLSTLRL